MIGGRSDGCLLGRGQAAGGVERVPMEFRTAEATLAETPLTVPTTL